MELGILDTLSWFTSYFTSTVELCYPELLARPSVARSTVEIDNYWLSEMIDLVQEAHEDLRSCVESSVLIGAFAAAMFLGNRQPDSAEDPKFIRFEYSKIVEYEGHHFTTVLCRYCQRYLAVDIYNWTGKPSEHNLSRLLLLSQI